MSPWLVGAASASLAAALTPVAAAWARRLGALDEPGGRRRHTGSIPRLGGLAIAGAAGCVALAVVARLGGPALEADNAAAPHLLLGLGAGALLATAIGLWDDARALSPRLQLAGQVTVGLVAVAATLWLQRFTNPLTGNMVDMRAAFGGGLLGLALVSTMTVLWYAGFMNTVNWLDGIDGLAASVSGVAALLFAVHMVVAFDQRELALLPLALAGACLGFLPWNRPPARVFMGSSGSMFLGYALAGLALLAPAKVATALLVMCVPIVDFAWQIVYRARRGQAPWVGDRGHLHHRLYDRGWSPGAVVALYVALSAVLGSIAVLVPATMPGRGGVKLAALAVVAALTLAGLWRLAREDSAVSATPIAGSGG